MMRTFDAIVIGAGNAGLTTAATMAKEGLKTFVIERNTVPGGCATSFRRGRFEFDLSLHELANIGTKEAPGSIRRMLDGFGADIDWRRDEKLFRVIAGGEDGYDVTMPAGEENFCLEMEKQVPGSYASVKEVFTCVKKANEAIKYLSSGKPDPKILMSEHVDFMRMAGHSVDECLDALGMPKKAQNIIKTYWSYLGADTCDMDFAHYIMMLERYVTNYPSFPPFRSHEISLAIADAVIENGGEVRYNTEVTRVLTKDGKAYGVIVGGEEIHAKYIVANCFPDTLYSKMLAENEVPLRAKKLINARKPAQLFFSVYLGLNRSCSDIGINDYCIFLFDTPNAHEQYLSAGDIDNSFLISTCLNTVMPEASPENTCILSLMTLLTEETWGKIEPKDYKKVKDRIAKRLINTFENRLGISVMPYIEEIEIAAPPTFARYLNTPNGTPYGYEVKDFDRMITRIMSAKNEQFIKNLYFVGAHGERTVGYTSTYANGNSVGKRIVKEEFGHGK